MLKILCIIYACAALKSALAINKFSKFHLDWQLGIFVIVYGICRGVDEKHGALAQLAKKHAIIPQK